MHINTPQNTYKINSNAYKRTRKAMKKVRSSVSNGLPPSPALVLCRSSLVLRELRASVLLREIACSRSVAKGSRAAPASKVAAKKSAVPP